jgi:hypothetical protein
MCQIILIHFHVRVNEWYASVYLQAHMNADFSKAGHFDPLGCDCMVPDVSKERGVFVVSFTRAHEQAYNSPYHWEFSPVVCSRTFQFPCAAVTQTGGFWKFNKTKVFTLSIPVCIDNLKWSKDPSSHTVPCISSLYFPETLSYFNYFNPRICTYDPPSYLFCIRYRGYIGYFYVSIHNSRYPILLYKLFLNLCLSFGLYTPDDDGWCQPKHVVFLENKVKKYKERCVKTDLYFI